MFRNYGIARMFLLSAEGAAAGGAPAANNTAPVNAETAPPAQPELGKDGTPFDAARAQATITALREKEKAGDAAVARLAQIEADKAKAEEESLKQQGEFERIADKYKTDFESASGELETTKAERDQAFTLLQQEADKRVAALPEAVRKFVPDAKNSGPLERLAKVAELETLGAAFTPAKAGVGPIKGAQSAGNGAAAQEPAKPKALGFL